MVSWRFIGLNLRLRLNYKLRRFTIDLGLDFWRHLKLLLERLDLLPWDSMCDLIVSVTNVLDLLRWMVVVDHLLSDVHRWVDGLWLLSKIAKSLQTVLLLRRNVDGCLIYIKYMGRFLKMFRTLLRTHLRRESGSVIGLISSERYLVLALAVYHRGNIDAVVRLRVQVKLWATIDQLLTSCILQVSLGVCWFLFLSIVAMKHVIPFGHIDMISMNA